MPRVPVEFEPKLVAVLREGYSRAQWSQDLLAGLVVGVVALPLAIAFAIASGVRPEQGLVTAVVAGFLISALSGSRVQIGGPTGAFVVLVHAIVVEHGYEGLAVATMMAGGLLVAMGLARLGTVIRFIPYPVTVGFTSGIALIIAAGQVPEALGLAGADLPPEFLAKLRACAAHLGDVDPWSLALSAGTVAVVRLWPKARSRVPGPLVALLACTLAVQLLGLPVETIGSRFGGVPQGLPLPRLPRFDAVPLGELVSPAVAIALLAGIESLLSAVVADGMTGRRHRSNMELIGQGVANLAAPLFGGIPATGAIARTATNVRNGGRTPVAGMVHALTLLVILLVAGEYAALVPLSALAGILLVVAYNMSEWRVFVRLLRGPGSDVLVLLVTFLLTVLVDLVVAIQAGVVLASLLFMRRMAEVAEVRSGAAVLAYEDDEDPRGMSELPPDVAVFQINGSFFFGAAQKFAEALGQTAGTPRVMILRMRHVPVMDATGLHALEEVVDRAQRQGTRVLLSGVQPQPLDAMRRAGLAERLGPDAFVPGFVEALRRAGATDGQRP